MKRVFWGSVGYAAGLGTSVYVQRRVRRTVERYTSDQLRDDLVVRRQQMVERARDVVIDLRAAAVEGVETMRVREQELRQEFALPEPPARPGHAPRPARLGRR